MSSEEIEYDSQSEEEFGSDVQLGFVEQERNELFENRNWSDWDGGKIGGWPSWLDPQHLPTSQSLQCEYCKEPLSFLSQIYCPLDTPQSAYHRSLYVFCCRKSPCVKNGSIKCIRTQLPRINEFYPIQGSASALASEQHTPMLCELCGCKADFQCSKCRAVHYCSKQHQKKHWSLHKAHCQSSSPDSPETTTIDPKERLGIDLGVVYPTHGISVSEECLDDPVPSQPASGTSVADITKSLGSATVWEGAADAEVGESGEDDDQHLTQQHYNKALGNEAPDPVYDQFMARVRRGGMDQVLRYSRWPNDEQILRGNGPLLLSRPGITDMSTVPAAPSQHGSCKYCGAPRKFEFQIMPQMLHHLHVDRHTSLIPSSVLNPPPAPTNDAQEATSSDSNANQSDVPPNVPVAAVVPAAPTPVFLNSTHEDIDWGTIDVYTCSASCSPPQDGSCTYLEEAVVMQQPIELNPSTQEPELPDGMK